MLITLSTIISLSYDKINSSGLRFLNEREVHEKDILFSHWNGYFLSHHRGNLIVFILTELKCIFLMDTEISLCMAWRTQ